MPPIDYIPRTRELYSHYTAYRWVVNQDVPWTPLKKPLSQSRIALASSCGVYVKGQTSYYTRDDTSLRLIPKATPVDKLRIVHFGYLVDDARKDPNCVFPLERLRELERDGVIGELADPAYGFMGGIYSARRVREDLAPRFVDLAHQQRLDLLFLVPAWPICHQTVGLVARAVEGSGIATLTMTSALDITQAVKPPRSVFLNFPLGHQTGKPHQPALQRQILLDAFRALESMTTPGSIIHLPYLWDPTNASWESTDYLPGYLPPYTRSNTPMEDY